MTQRTRREFFRATVRTVVAAALAGGAVVLGLRKGPSADACARAGGCASCPETEYCPTFGAITGDDTVWQIDPHKCVQCGRCATHCVREDSAVKAVHVHQICGHCNLCTAYLDPGYFEKSTAAENQLCPTGAIIRTFVEDPYYTYDIDEELCIGCGKCVKGCEMFGNGSMFLQIRHDRCKNCNVCAIGDACPSRAFQRVPARSPYLLKKAD